MSEKENMVSNKTHTEELMIYIFKILNFYCFTPPQIIQSFF